MFLVLTSCEDTQTSKNQTTNNTTPPKSKIEKPIVEKIPQEPEREFPLLNDKNAMEFFLEYDKNP